MKIEILGPGCARCEQLAKNVEEAAKSLGISYELVKVKDMAKIVGYGVMSTPGIVVDGKLKGAGKLFTVDEIKGFLTN